MAVDDARSGTWVTYAEGAVQSLRVRRCRLAVASGPDQGRHVDLESSWIRVGAHEGCDLVLSDRLVSGHHFEIVFEEAGYRLRDLDSTNGTYVAGHRIRDCYLNPGTGIYVGESRLKFEPLDDSVPIELSSAERFGDMVGHSVAMRALFAKLERTAPTDASVLITGDTGTGKELVAEGIHSHSGRRSGPFVVVDCGSIPDNLIASELFGHERGAFTGATQSYEGAFERANGGTLFLDEIGELPIDLQPNLLGVLERRQVRRIGGTKPIPLDIRVVAATNRDLAVEMNRGGFRSDLFYRLAVVQMRVPSLRERPDDIPVLAYHFVAQLGGTAASLSQKTLDSLCNHTFPGNVRELRNMIERSLILSQTGAVTPTPAPRPAGSAAASRGDGDDLHFTVDESVPYRKAKSHLLDLFDESYLRKLLVQHGGNVSKAARAAGIDRMTVHKMLSRLGMSGWRGTPLDS